MILNPCCFLFNKTTKTPDLMGPFLEVQEKPIQLSESITEHFLFAFSEQDYLK